LENVKFVAGLDGSISAFVYRPDGIEQDLTDCSITLNIAYENDDNAILSLPMQILGNNKCVAYLTPNDTEFLSKGEYELQLIITDIADKKNATSRVKLSVDKIIN
jgi:hypothetical protein